MLDNTVFVRENKNTSILFKGKKIGNVYKDSELKLFTGKNKKYVDEFNDYIKTTKKEYEKTPRATIQERIGGLDDETNEGTFYDTITDNSILEIQNKIDNIIHENDLKEFIDNKQDPRQTLFERDDLREFRVLVCFENIDPNLSENEKNELMSGKIEGLDKDYQYWRKKALDEPFETKEQIYTNFSKIAKHQADKMRLENNERPIHDEGIQILNEQAEESSLGRLERFKKWSK